MNDWIKPLKVYKKYLLAERILKNCCTSFAVLHSEPYEKPLLTEKQYPNVFVAANFLNVSHPFGDTSRTIEAIDLLEKNKHITTKRSPNLYEFSIKCTKEGEAAFNEGYYRNEVTKFWLKIIGVSGGVSGIILLLNRFL